MNSIVTSLRKAIRGRETRLDDFGGLLRLPPAEMITEIDFDAMEDMTPEQKLAHVISAARNDWVDGNITAENFPIDGTGRRFFLNEIFDSEDGVAAMKKAGFEQGNHIHGFAVSAKFPDEQRINWFRCPGSSARVNGRPSVVCFERGSSGRSASLLSVADGQPSRWRVLGVREILVLDAGSCL